MRGLHRRARPPPADFRGSVPDPGEAFWKSFADRLYHDVQRHRRRQWPSRLADLFRGAYVPRWAWGAATAAVLIVATWLVVRPLPDRASPTAARRQPAPAVDIIQEAANNKEVRQEDLERLSAWAARSSFRSGTAFPTCLPAERRAPGKCPER